MRCTQTVKSGIVFPQLKDEKKNAKIIWLEHCDVSRYLMWSCLSCMCVTSNIFIMARFMNILGASINYSEVSNCGIGTAIFFWGKNSGVTALFDDGTFNENPI